MINKLNQLDTSSDLALYRYGNGIKLLRPQQTTRHPNIFIGNSTGISVAELLKFDCNVYFLNAESVMQKINDTCASTMGFISANDSFGKTMFDISPEDNAKKVISTDIAVVKNNILRITEDTVIHFDGENQHFLTIKMPWYNHENKLTGIFGCSLLFGDQPIAESLMKISSLGVLNKSTLSSNPDAYLNGSFIDNVYITKREKEILFYLIRGKSAKSMGDLLGISRRTVEQHLDNLKVKLNVSFKDELIEKVIDSLF